MGTVPLGPDPAPILIYFVVGYVILPWRHAAPLTVLGLSIIHQALAIPILSPGGIMATDSTHVPFAGLLVAVAAVATDRTMAVSIPSALLAFTPSAITVGSRVLTGWPAVYLLTLLVEIAAAWTIGSGIARNRRRVHRLQLVQERTVAAVQEERARIAAELHDIVSHSVTVMTLHAAGGRKIMEADPTRTRQALELIERVGSQTMDELRRLLDVLRSADLVAANAVPLHELGELDSLLSPVRAIGITVDVTTVGDPGPLDSSIGHTAYRVLQEALTNVTKHAGTHARVDIRLTWSLQKLIVEVRDDGGSEQRTGGRPGYGLLGLQERVGLVGGDLTYGRNGRGFTVRAELPIADAGHRTPLDSPTEQHPES
ncbi:sensor histidine kinase [Sinomonas sp. G460-2]|uniref:sensor histidine kinase n=1 Tax=Sinomonas sp. G460-2 TaxID=3393464 RepID=UPI0039F01814